MTGCRIKTETHKSTQYEEQFKWLIFERPLLDTLELYVSKFDTTCPIHISFERSMTNGIVRLNFFVPQSFGSFKEFEYSFCALINKRRVFINLGIEQFIQKDSLFIKSMKFSPDCENNYFVIYDSSKVITVIHNLNDFSADFRPNKSRVFIPK